jgi:hypothetical protein
VLAENVAAVDNSFAVPTARGCGGALLAPVLDPIINGKLGLPSPAGKNAAILKGNVEQAVAYYVLLSESAPAAATSAATTSAATLSTASLSSVSGAVSAPATKTRASQRRNGMRVGTYAAVAKHL